MTIHEALDQTLAAASRLLSILLRLALATLAFLLDLITLIVHSLIEAIERLRGYGAVIIRVLCVALVIVAFAWSWPVLHATFGGDAIAALPATVFCVLPIAASQAFGWGWSGLLAAAASVAFAGALIPALSPLARGLLIASITGATVMHQIQVSRRR